jgi:hypothetical protein
MTRVILNGTIKGLRGRMGNLIFRQMPDGTTVVTSAPLEKNRRQKKRAKAKRSTRQKAHNERFEEAAMYAGRAARVEPVYRELAAVTPMRNAYNFALSDWFSLPEIRRIERQAGCIRVEAWDKVFVSGVKITILDGEGNVVEQGEAVRGEGDWWEFAPQAAGTSIVAEARDLAGNVTKAVR